MIGVMAAAVILLVLVVVFMFRGVPGLGANGANGTSPRKDHLGTTTPGLVKADAEDVVCRNNLEQIRDAIKVQQAMDPDGANPASLNDLHLPAEMLKCPLGGTYAYDPKTGTVHCTHPGHEKF